MYALRLGFPTVVNVNRRGTLSTELPTIADELRSVGYKTAIVGKWHVGASTVASLPDQRGYDVSHTMWGGGLFYYAKTAQYDPVGFLDIHDGAERRLLFFASSSSSSSSIFD
jgi:arylsulfatase A-like enzyme